MNLDKIIVPIELEGLDDLRALLTEWGEDDTTDVAQWARTLKQANADLVAKVNELSGEATRLTDEVQTLTPLAEQGKAYRAALIDEAITEGVRAFGAAFPEATFRKMLDGQDLDGIKSLRDYHATIAAQTLQGGRRTVDTTPAQPGETKAPEPADTTPDHVFIA